MGQTARGSCTQADLPFAQLEPLRQLHTCPVRDIWRHGAPCGLDWERERRSDSAATKSETHDQSLDTAPCREDAVSEKKGANG